MPVKHAIYITSSAGRPTAWWHCKASGCWLKSQGIALREYAPPDLQVRSQISGQTVHEEEKIDFCLWYRFKAWAPCLGGKDDNRCSCWMHIAVCQAAKNGFFHWLEITILPGCLFSSPKLGPHLLRFSLYPFAQSAGSAICLATIPILDFHTSVTFHRHPLSYSTSSPPPLLHPGKAWLLKK